MLKLKACMPDQTIARINTIIENNNLFYTMREHPSCINGVHSCSIRLNDLAMFNTNGKGVTSSFSQASGLSEMMERLQAGTVVSKLDEYGKYNPPDAVELNTSQFSKEQVEVTSKLFKDGTWELINSFLCVPYIDASTKKPVLLPFEAIRMACHSNGLCAGNTVNEAIIQGLCEIFERSALSKLYHRKIEPVVIPNSAIGQQSLITMINRMTECGLEVQLLDFSEGGIYPVAGVLVSMNDRNCLVLGSAPHYSVAIERCITELYQGATSIEYFNEYKLHKCVDLDTLSYDQIMRVFFRAIRHGWSISNKLVQTEQSFSIEKSIFSFAEEDFTNDTTLKRLIDIFLRDGNSVFLRDYSFLGYPTYQVFIPAVSQYNKLTPEIYLAQKNNNLPNRLQSIHKLDNYTNTEKVSRMLNIIEPLYERRGRFDTYIFYNTFIMPQGALNVNSEVIYHDADLFIAALHYKTGNKKRAESVLKSAILERSSAKLVGNMMAIIEATKSLDKPKCSILDKCYNYYISLIEQAQSGVLVGEDLINTLKKQINSYIYNHELI